MPLSSETTPLSSSTTRNTSWERLAYGISVFCLLGAAVLFALNSWSLRELLVDDAYITYRFGARLAHEGTLRWNLAPLPGGLEGEVRALLEKPVEGYTSFLAVLISAVFERLGLDPLRAWKILGVCLVLMAAASIVWGARAYGAARGAWANRAGVPLFLAAAYCAHPLTALHAMSGMETALFGALLIFLTALAFRILFDPQGSPLRMDLLAAGFLLLGMTRPEGVLWSLLVGMGVLWGIGKVSEDSRNTRWRFVRAVLLFFVLPGAIYFLWRWLYFSSFLPATFYAKAGGAMRPSPLGRLHTYLPSHWPVWQYLRDNWLALACAASAIFAARLWTLRKTKKKKSDPRSAALVILFCASLVCIAFFAHINLLMGYAYRFLFPFGQTFLLTLLLPALLLAGNIATGDPERRDRKGSLRAQSLVGIFAILILVGSCAWTSAFIVRYAYGKGPEHQNGAYSLVQSNNLRTSGYAPLGQALEKTAQSLGRQMTLFHHNMGELMYWAPSWDSIDPVGLVDLPIARLGYNADYVFAREPDLFILPSNKKDVITEKSYIFNNNFLVFPDISRALYLDERMKAYKYLGYYSSTESKSAGGLHFLLKRELADKHPKALRSLRQEIGIKIHPDFQARVE